MPREAIIGTVVAAVSVWVMLVVVFLPRQAVPGGDFMQFYTLGTAARAGDWGLQYDWPRLHELQVSLVPESAPYVYSPSYPPLVAAFYAPFSLLPFRAAYAAWALSAGALYLGLIVFATRACRRLRGITALAAAVLFPPFIALILTGQTTLLPLAGFVVGWHFRERRRDVLAGLALSLVALKPNFGIALAAVLLVARSWRIVGGTVAGLATIAALTWLICGADVIREWFGTAMHILRDPAQIEPTDARHTHALRTTLESVAPRWAAAALWGLVSLAAVWLTVQAWRRDVTFGMAALVLAAVVVSPHVLSYDAVLLAPACLWLVDRGLATGRRALVWTAVALGVLYVVPYARVAGVPLTVPLAMWLISECRLTASADHRSSP